MILEEAFQERKFQTEAEVEKYMVEADFFKRKASEKDAQLENWKDQMRQADFNKETLQDKEILLDQCKDQLKHFDGINKLRDDLMKALENENAHLKEQMSQVRIRFKEVKTEFKAYKIKKRAQRRAKAN